MFIPDAGAASMIAFITGCDSATDGNLLSGFNEWVFARLGGVGKTSIMWDAQLADAVNLGGAPKGRHLTEFTDEQNAALVDAIFEALDEFLAEHPHNYVTTSAPD